jgi:hypothetical protein
MKRGLFMKTFDGLLVLAAGALLSSIVSAACAQGGGWAKASDTDMVRPFGMSVDHVEDLDVVSADGDKIGEIEDVLTKGGAQKALGVEFEGFSGYSPGKDLNVIVPLDDFVLGGKGRVTLKAGPAAVKSMETYPD